MLCEDISHQLLNHFLFLSQHSYHFFLPNNWNDTFSRRLFPCCCFFFSVLDWTPFETRRVLIHCVTWLKSVSHLIILCFKRRDETPHLLSASMYHSRALQTSDVWYNHPIPSKTKGADTFQQNWAIFKLKLQNDCKILTTFSYFSYSQWRQTVNKQPR